MHTYVPPKHHKSLVGKRVGYVEFLYPVRKPPESTSTSVHYLCKCHNCGKEWVSNTEAYKRSPKRTDASCGCIGREKSSKRMKTPPQNWREGNAARHRKYRTSVGADPDILLSPKHDLERSTIQRHVGTRVFSRDNFTCVICHIRGGSLHTHHIHAFSTHPERRFDLSNMVTLCKDCHVQIVHLGNPVRYPSGDPALETFLSLIVEQNTLRWMQQ